MKEEYQQKVLSRIVSVCVCINASVCFCPWPTAFLFPHCNIRVSARCLELMKKYIMISAHLQPLAAHTLVLNSLQTLPHIPHCSPASLLKHDY